MSGNIQTEFRPIMKVVRFPGNYGSDFEILRERGRLRGPLEASGGPGIIAGNLAVESRPSKVNHREQVTDSQDGSAGSRHDVVHLKLRRIHMVAARHAEIAENELREEGEVEAYEKDEGGNARNPFGVHPAGNLGPPEMQSTEITHHRAADHDVVEVGDDEVGIVNVHVDAKAAEEQSGETTDEEQAEEAEGIEHRRVERDGATEESGGPVKGFYRGRNGDQEGEEGKCHR